MASTDDQVGTEPRVKATLRHDSALRALLQASNSYAEARQKHAEAFLLAKISSRKPTDRQAEASAEVEAGAELVAAETLLFITKETYAAALRQMGDQ